MADSHGGGHGGHGPNWTVIAVCGAVIAVAIAAANIFGSSAPRAVQYGFQPLSDHPSGWNSGCCRHDNRNRDNVPAGFYVIKR
jgi:hypothetical protein